MDISADIRILGGIKTGSVFYFEEESFASNEPHYFIVLNKNPRKEKFLILVSASSQVGKRQLIAVKLGFPPETLVVVRPEQYKLFRTSSIFDCNRAFEKSSQSLIEKLKNRKLRVCTEIMPHDIVTDLINGVLASSQVSEEIHNALR